MNAKRLVVALILLGATLPALSFALAEVALVWWAMGMAAMVAALVVAISRQADKRIALWLVVPGSVLAGLVAGVALVAR